MSDHDVVGDAIERLEWSERKEDDSPVKKSRQFTRRTALTGLAAGVGALGLESMGGVGMLGTAMAAGGGASGIFGSSQKLKFTLVNHVTTNVFFTPTKNGAADACKLLGCSYDWTGSATSNVSEMVNAINSAVTAKVNGIGSSLIDPHAFNAPVQAALKANIPVVSYNADEPQTGRLAYIGQSLFASGQAMGQKIAGLLPHGGQIALFIATPGSANIQPRIDGAQATLKSHKSIKPSVVATGAAVPMELSTIMAWAKSHSTAKGMFAVDGGSTQSIAQTMAKQGLRKKGWVGGGYDLTPITEKLLHAGEIDFTIDQQPYLQGFLPILQLYIYNVSKGLSGIADTDTGLKFLDKTTVAPYSSTKSRYEGTSATPGVH